MVASFVCVGVSRLSKRCKKIAQTFTHPSPKPKLIITKNVSSVVVEPVLKKYIYLFIKKERLNFASLVPQTRVKLKSSFLSDGDPKFNFVFSQSFLKRNKFLLTILHTHFGH